MTYREYFSRSLGSAPQRLHFAAHSHHLWPDVSFEAQQRSWLDAATRADDKWEQIFGTVLPRVQHHIARTLNLSDPTAIAFAPNTHEFLLRLLSCFEGTPRILSTDGEFHSFTRQSRRWEEAGLVRLERVAVEPFSTFPERFLEAAGRGGHDLVFFSQVFYNSGYFFDQFAEVVAAVPSPSIYVVIDGYHGFMALPTDLSSVEDRAFYLAGGYKYAMSGEGVCFMHCPPGYGPRPVNTGWIAQFGELEQDIGDAPVSYRPDGSRFLGATFDPSGLYRFNAVMDLLGELGVTVADIHEHARSLQARFLERLDRLGLEALNSSKLVPDRATRERGNFLTFRLPEAAQIHRRLRHLQVTTDHRGNSLRFGFGLYQDERDVDDLCRRLAAALR
ncbi:MAG: aminotransferase class V-fold PLP-dependent enzyme [Acidimicrobiia bacterium]